MERIPEDSLCECVEITAVWVDFAGDALISESLGFSVDI